MFWDILSIPASGLMKNRKIPVFIKPEDGTERISQNAIPYLQYYATS